MKQDDGHNLFRLAWSLFEGKDDSSGLEQICTACEEIIGPRSQSEILLIRYQLSELFLQAAFPVLPLEPDAILNRIKGDIELMRRRTSKAHIEIYARWLSLNYPDLTLDIENNIPYDVQQIGAFKPKRSLPTLFAPDEFDIFINKRTLEAFIFHGKLISYDIARLEYSLKDYSVVVVMRDGREFDLGGKIEWMLREYWMKLKRIGIVRTENGASIEGVYVPIVHVEQHKVEPRIPMVWSDDE